MRPALVRHLDEAFGTSLGAWLVPTPEVVYALAISAGLLLYLQRTRADGLPRYHALGSVVWAAVAGFLGARLLYLLLRSGELLQQPSMLWDLGGSTISWGAYLGGAAGFVLYFRVHRESPWKYADVAGSTVGFGTCIGRFGCLLNGDDYGRVTELPLAVTYPPGSYAYGAHLAQGLIQPAAATSVPVHPVQLYLAANALALFLLFSWLWRSRRLQLGMLFFSYWAAYGVTRFGLEFLREDAGRTVLFGLPDGQTIALCVSLASIAALAVLHRRPPRS